MMSGLLPVTGLLLCLCWGNSLPGQDLAARHLSFMVIPKVEKGVKVSDILRDDPLLEFAIREVQSALDGEEYQVYDFSARMEAFRSNAGQQETVDDPRAAFLNYVKPDVYCEVTAIVKDCAPGLHRASVTLTAYLTSSGQLLTTESEASNCFESAAATTSLVRRAVGKAMEKFREQLRKDIDRTQETGQSVTLTFTLEDSSPISYDTEVSRQLDGVPYIATLGEQLTEWLREYADIIYLKSSGVIGPVKRYDEVRLPLIDAKNGRLYDLDIFTGEIGRFLRRLQPAVAGTFSRLQPRVTKVNGLVNVQIRTVD